MSEGEAGGVTVELFGIARRRAGRDRIVVCQGIAAPSLGEALEEAGRRMPELAAECLDGARPRSGYLANVNAGHFTTDPTLMLAPGDHVLLLAADAGG
tara:strand:- start:733 stop:1026 length:294 start_codon:yes stop_codon:yes gene_type:complete